MRNMPERSARLIAESAVILIILLQKLAMQIKNNCLQIRIEKSKKTTEEDIQKFYYTIYKMAENLGFNVVVPESTNKQLTLLTERINEKKEHL